MKALAIDFLAWQNRSGTEEAYSEWPQGFRGPRCGHDHRYDCSCCHYQAMLMMCALFHSTNLLLTKWLFSYLPDGIGHSTSEYYFRDGERALEPGVSTLNT